MLSRFRMKKHLRLPSDDQKGQLIQVLLEEKSLETDMSKQENIEHFVKLKLENFSLREVHCFIQDVADLTVMKLEKANHFKIVEGGAECNFGQLFEPCFCKTDCGGKNMKIEQIPLDAIIFPKVKYDDLLKAVNFHKPRNTPELIQVNIDFELGKDKSEIVEQTNRPERNNKSVYPRRNAAIILVIAILFIGLIITIEILKE